VHVVETGDHLGRKGAKLGGGVGLVVGLVAPPLLAATAIGAAAGGVMGKFAKHRLESGIAEKMDAALPPSSGGVIAVYDTEGAGAVDKAVANAVKNPWHTSTARARKNSRPDWQKLKPGWAAELLLLNTRPTTKRLK